MNWGAPAFLWSTLVLVPLVAVYFIRTRPRRQVVTVFFLWEKILDQKTSRSLFQRLRNLLSLLLVALAFLGAIFALARPTVGEKDDRDLLIVIDRSASMNGGKTSRIELAKKKAESWISGLGGTRRAALATIDTELRYLEHLTDQGKPLKEALKRVEGSDLPLRSDALEELSLLASGEGANVRILWLTDGKHGEVELPEGIERVLVGEVTDNFAITAADLRWQSGDEVRLFVSLASTSEEEKEVDLELVHPETSEVARYFTMKLPPGGQVSESMVVEGLRPGGWEVRIVGEDDLMADNVVPLGLTIPRATRVEVVSETPFFFERVLEAFARADSLFEMVEDGPEMVLAQGVVPDAEVSIIFTPSGESEYWTQVGDELSVGSPEVKIEDHVLVERLDPGLLSFAGARKLEAPRGAVVVLAHPDGSPLLYTVQKDGRRAVVVNLDPAKDDFFLSPWFPVMIHDASVFLTGRENRLRSVFATGEVVGLPGRGEVGRVRRQYGGVGEDLSGESPVLVKNVGHYEVEKGGEVSYFGGGLLSPGESVGGLKGDEGGLEIEPAKGWSLAGWLLFMAVLVVVVEEGLYQRRKVG